MQRLDDELPLRRTRIPVTPVPTWWPGTDVELAPGERATRADRRRDRAARTGYAAFVHPRSGLAARLGVTTLNAPGTVDAGYRGEIKVTLVNTDRHDAGR